MFLSGVTNSSKPVAYAALSSSPLTKSVPSGLLRFRDGVAFKKRDQRRGRSVVKESYASTVWAGCCIVGGASRLRAPNSNTATTCSRVTSTTP